MKNLKESQKGIAHLPVIILIFLALIGVGVAVYNVYQKSSDQNISVDDRESGEVKIDQQIQPEGTIDITDDSDE